MSASPTSGRPRQIGRFVLHEQLGRGAQATVWRAHDERLDRDVALKLLNPDADTVAVSQWLHEARAVSRLAHPNIVPVFEADEQSGQAHLVFELVRGRTLADQLRADGPMPPGVAVQIMAGVLDALVAAHAEGIVHRDLKPSNILIDASGRPRVMDFGIAARVSDHTDGRIVGTPGYMSPEAAEGAPAAPSMDVFSAGMVLAEMLLGRPLLRERDPIVALRRVCQEDFALPSEVSCDDGLRAHVRRALSRDPTHRFSSAQAFRDALVAGPQSGQGAGPKIDSAKPTLDFLLRRMRHKSDFPALSDAVLRIQRIVASDTESLGSLANEILKDVALTNKLLRMVNTAHYSHAGGGSISTVSRAVALVGFAGIRNMALSLVLLEHMQDKAHAGRLKEEFVCSLLAGQLASELTPLARDVEEAYLAALFQNLGRLLTEFYFPEEARTIRELLAAAGSKSPPTPQAMESVSERVLGIGFEALGVGVAKSWGLPDGLQRAMRRPQGDPPPRMAERGIERHRWLAALTNDMAAAMRNLEPDQARLKLDQLAEMHAKVLGLTPAAVRAAVEGARQKLGQLVPAMGLVVVPGTPTQRMLAAPPTQTVALSAPEIAEANTADLLSTHALQATLVQPRPGEPKPVDNDPKVEDADILLDDREVVPVADMLAAGIQDVTDTLAADSFKLNEVLRMILETMYRALRFRRVVFCLRDPKTQRLLGRFGLGDDADKVASRFEVALAPTPGKVIDVFSAVCQKGVDTLITDASEERIKARLPAWYHGAVAAPSFLLLPMTMKGAPFALIYADAEGKGGIVLGEREMSLVRTLRNQAVMAFRQAT